MIKKIYIHAAIAMSFLLAVSAQAKVTPVQEYNPVLLDSASSPINLSCSAYGLSSSTKANADCIQKNLIDGTVCYDCHCKSNFKYSCNTTGVVPNGSACTADGPAKYASCSCANGYVDSSSVKTNLSSISYPSPVTGDDGTKCYKTSGFACASGYKRFSANPGVSGVTYTTQTPYSGSSLKCVSGYTASSKYRTSLPSSGYDCLTHNSVYLSSLKNPIYLYYFTGCSNSGNCTTSINDCISYNTQKDSASGITCYKVTGCQNGLQGSYLCGSSTSYSVNSAYFASTKIAKGSASCVKVTGCTSPYSKAYFGVAQSSLDSYKTSGSTSYDVQQLTMNDGQIVCRTPSGCNTSGGYYPNLPDCIKATTNNSSGTTCYKPTGCKTGLYNGYICNTATSVNSSYFRYSSSSLGSISCTKVTGCASPYTEACKGNCKAASSYTTSGSKTYEVHAYPNSSAPQIVCRKEIEPEPEPEPEQCPTGQYDYSCGTDCWGGKLYWWIDYMQ